MEDVRSAALRTWTRSRQRTPLAHSHELSPHSDELLEAFPHAPDERRKIIVAVERCKQFIHTAHQRFATFNVILVAVIHKHLERESPHGIRPDKKRGTGQKEMMAAGFEDGNERSRIDVRESESQPLIPNTFKCQAKARPVERAALVQLGKLLLFRGE